MNTDKIFAEAIAGEYAPKDTSKVVALKKLDRKAKSKAHIFAYTFGIIMSLLLGVGMCLSMKVIGDGSMLAFIIGIAIGVVGIAGVSVNYPIFKKMLAEGKQKYAFEIMQLAKEISEEADQRLLYLKECVYEQIGKQIFQYRLAYGRSIDRAAERKGSRIHHRKGTMRKSGCKPTNLLSAL